MTQPEIHTWWPQLRAASKEMLDGIGDAPVPAEVREEITAVTGIRVADGFSLSPGDRDFIRTQREQVD